MYFDNINIRICCVDITPVINVKSHRPSGARGRIWAMPETSSALDQAGMWYRSTWNYVLTKGSLTDPPKRSSLSRCNVLGGKVQGPPLRRADVF